MNILTPEGTPVRSPGNGYVTMAQWYGGYGQSVMIDLGNNNTVLFGHLSENLNVEYGQTVKQGDIIGYAGSTGLSDGTHFFTGWLIDSNYVNPLDYIKP
ncbi:M23 family metallopeptidase [Eubacterium limosum]|nr:M23 family metallopeptidase [Eubacterium limosum]